MDEKIAKMIEAYTSAGVSPLGSYSGLVNLPVFGDDEPTQDADDL